MSRCLIVFFSQGGTTKRVAQAVSKGLSAHGHEVDLHDLSDGPPPDHGRYDVLGIGCPAHYYRPAIIVCDYLATLSGLSGKPVFTFVLYAAYVGDAGNVVRGALEAKGGNELGYARFRGAGRFLGYLRHGYQFSPADPSSDAIAEAERFGGDLAERLAGSTHVPAAHDPSPPAVYRLERFLTSRFFIRQVYSRLFRVDRRSDLLAGDVVDVLAVHGLQHPERGEGSGDPSRAGGPQERADDRGATSRAERVGATAAAAVLRPRSCNE